MPRRCNGKNKKALDAALANRSDLNSGCQGLGNGCEGMAMLQFFDRKSTPVRAARRAL
jgi:hypothetical protein